MKKYRRASEGRRICNRCEQELPATAEYFVADATRVLGIGYECRECQRERKRGRDNRPDRWSLMTPEQRLKVRARQQRYNATAKGRAIFLRSAYTKIDACDLTTAEVLEIIQRPCEHCGTTESNRGLDRIDNSLPHIKGNVVAACAPCNFARGDRFTFDEMKRIGAVIRQVIQDRKTKEAGSEGHLENSTTNRPTQQEPSRP